MLTLPICRRREGSQSSRPVSLSNFRNRFDEQFHSWFGNALDDLSEHRLESAGPYKKLPKRTRSQEWVEEDRQLFGRDVGMEELIRIGTRTERG